MSKYNLENKVSTKLLDVQNQLNNIDVQILSNNQLELLNQELDKLKEFIHLLG
jgi:hypothetical protein